MHCCRRQTHKRLQEQMVLHLLSITSSQMAAVHRRLQFLLRQQRPRQHLPRPLTARLLASTVLGSLPPKQLGSAQPQGLHLELRALRQQDALWPVLLLLQRQSRATTAGQRSGRRQATARQKAAGSMPSYLAAQNWRIVWSCPRMRFMTRSWAAALSSSPSHLNPARRCKSPVCNIMNASTEHHVSGTV